MNIIKPLTKSLKFKKKFWKLVLSDLAHYVVLALLILIFASVLVKNVQNISEELQIDTLDDLSFEAMQSDSSLLGKFYATFWISIVVCGAIYLLSQTYFKGKIYATLLKEKLSKAKFVKFLILTIILLAITILLSLLLRPERIVLFIVYLFVTFYLTVMFSIALFKTKKPKELFKEFYRIAIKKIHHFIIPLIITLVLFMVINTATLLLFGVNPYLLILGILLMVIFITWTKYYFVLVYKSVE